MLAHNLRVHEENVFKFGAWVWLRRLHMPPFKAGRRDEMRRDNRVAKRLLRPLRLLQLILKLHLFNKNKFHSIQETLSHAAASAFCFALSAAILRRLSAASLP